MNETLWNKIIDNFQIVRPLYHFVCQLNVLYEMNYGISNDLYYVFIIRIYKLKLFSYKARVNINVYNTHAQFIGRNTKFCTSNFYSFIWNPCGSAVRSVILFRLYKLFVNIVKFKIAWFAIRVLDNFSYVHETSHIWLTNHMYIKQFFYSHLCEKRVILVTLILKSLVMYNKVIVKLSRNWR